MCNPFSNIGCIVCYLAWIFFYITQEKISATLKNFAYSEKKFNKTKMCILIFVWALKCVWIFSTNLLVSYFAIYTSSNSHILYKFILSLGFIVFFKLIHFVYFLYLLHIVQSIQVIMIISLNYIKNYRSIELKHL